MGSRLRECWSDKGEPVCVRPIFYASSSEAEVLLTPRVGHEI